MVMLAGSGVGHCDEGPKPLVDEISPGPFCAGAVYTRFPAAFRLARNAVTELPAAKPSTHAEFGAVYGVWVSRPDTKTTARLPEVEESLGDGAADDPQPVTNAPTRVARAAAISAREKGDFMASG